MVKELGRIELVDSYLASPHVSHPALVPQVAHLGVVTPRRTMLKIGHISKSFLHPKCVFFIGLPIRNSCINSIHEIIQRLDD